MSMEAHGKHEPPGETVRASPVARGSFATRCLFFGSLSLGCIAVVFVVLYAVSLLLPNADQLLFDEESKVGPWLFYAITLVTFGLFWLLLKLWQALARLLARWRSHPGSS